MKLWNRFIDRIKGRFPEPEAHVLSPQQIAHYWISLSPEWRAQCIVRIMRTSPWPEPEPTMLQFARNGEEYGDLVHEHLFHTDLSTGCILARLGPGSFILRIDRVWNQRGVQQKKELCIANLRIDQPGSVK